MDVFVDTATGRYRGIANGPLKEGCAVVAASNQVFPRLAWGIDYLYESGAWSMTCAGAKMLLNENWRRVRAYRDALLVITDFTQLPDSPYDPTAKAAWAVYRQALRDVTHKPDPTAIVWPDPPPGDYPWLRSILPMPML